MKNFLYLDRDFLLLSLFMGISTLGYSILLYYFPIILVSKGISTSILGLTYTVITILQIFLRIPIGVFVDKFGYKLSLVLSSFLNFVLYLLMSVSPLLFLVSYILSETLARVLNSLGYSRFLYSTKNAGKAFGTFSLITSLFAAVGIYVGSVSLVNIYFLRLTLQIVAVLFLFSAVLRLTFLHEERKNVIVKRKKLFDLSILDKRLILFAVYGILSSLLSLEAFYVPIFLSTKISASELGQIYVGYPIIMAIFPIIWSNVILGKNQFNFLLLCTVSEAIIIFLFPFSSSFLMFLLLFYLWSVFSALNIVASSNVTQKLTKEEFRATQVASIQTLKSIFSAVFNVIYGVLYSINPLYPFIFSATIGSIGLFVVIMISKT